MWQWLICNRVIIEIFTNIAVVLAVLIAVAALFMNIRTFSLQRKNSQAEFFQQVTLGIDSIFREMGVIAPDNRNALRNWFERLAGALEYYAFYANREYLNQDMEVYYLPTIEKTCRKISEIPWLAKEFRERKEFGTLCELREYYKRHLKKECPI